ncbi:hypothetical protein [Bifidobacterium dentium]|uniref:hypothetical protein n=1 Tax=Bifidobacterium dentium TaxID=1689 RepID=UPI0026DCB398|nr:hypothetical protein [Bifidobacterium dentium]
MEEFERKHPAMLEAIAKAVRKELETSHTNGHESADIQPGTGKGYMMNVHLEIDFISPRTSNRIAAYLFAHSGKWIAELTDNPIKIETIDGERAIVTFPAIAEVDLKEFMSMLGDE